MSIVLLCLCCWPSCDLGRGSGEAVLRANLQAIRQAIEQYREDQGHGPGSLEHLVEANYLRIIPHDPVAESSETWILVFAEPFGSELVEVRSGAQGTGSDGTPYASW